MFSLKKVFVLVILESRILGNREPYLCESDELENRSIRYKCPDYDTPEWRCRRDRSNCKDGKVYHCAKDYNISPMVNDYEDKVEIFTEGCALEKNCSKGEEPILTFIVNQRRVDDPVVYCEKCFNRNRYNSYDHTPSSTFSQCEEEKQNICRTHENKLECSDGNSSSDRYCRCDARKGYRPDDAQWPIQIGQRCSYDNWKCKLDDVCGPENEDMLLNYTCGPKCPMGTKRSNDTDDCIKVPNRVTTSKPTIEQSTKKVTDKVDKTTVTVKPPISTRSSKKKSSDDGSLSKGEIIAFCIPISIIVVVVVVVVSVGIACHCKKKGCKACYNCCNCHFCNNGNQPRGNGQSTSNDIAVPVEQHALLDGHQNGASSPLPTSNSNGSPKPADTDTKITPNVNITIVKGVQYNVDSERVKFICDNDTDGFDSTDEYNGTDISGVEGACNKDGTESHLPQPIEEKDAKQLLQELSSIKDFPAFVTKCQKAAKPDIRRDEFDLSPYPVIKYSNMPEGFKAYETSGSGNGCLYQSISRLLSGTEEYQTRLRLLSVLNAVEKYDNYKNQLKKYELEDIRTFFNDNLRSIEVIANLTDKDNLIDKDLQQVIMETCQTDNDSSRLHVCLLQAVVNRKIEQHFQENAVKETISNQKNTLDVEYDKLKPPFHIFWVKSSRNKSAMNHIVPLQHCDQPSKTTV